MSFLCSAHISQLPSWVPLRSNWEGLRSAVVPEKRLSLEDVQCFDVLVMNWWGECGLEVKPSLTAAAVSTCYSVVVSGMYLFLNPCS